MLFDLTASHRVLRRSVVVEQTVRPAFPCAAVFIASAAMPKRESDVSITGAIQPQVLRFFRQVLPFGLLAMHLRQDP